MARREQPGLAPATLSDVARLAKVSLATASRALHGADNRRVGPELQARVEAAAEKLHYAASLAARSTARGSSLTIGVMVSTIADPFFSAVAEGAVGEAEARGYNVMVSVTDRGLDREVQLARLMRGQHVRGLIMVGSRPIGEGQDGGLKAELDPIAKAGARIAVISKNVLGFDSVLIDNYAASYALGRDLLSIGYRSFAVMSGPDHLFTAIDRVKGFTDALSEAGISPGHGLRVIHDDFTWEGGARAMMRLGRSSVKDTELVYATTDVMILGAYSVLRDWGVSVPQDIAIAGFNDIQSLRDVVPGITTVRLPLFDLGRMAADVVLRDLDEPPVEIVLPATVVLRESTPPRVPASPTRRRNRTQAAKQV